MKKIISSLLMLAAVGLFFASCDEDRDSNPTFHESDGTFVLNTPAYAANNIYDLQNSDYIVFTTNQPNYGGFPLSTTYTTYVSLDGQNWQALNTTSQTVTVSIPASEINEAILDLAGDTDLSDPIPLYVKMTAKIFGQDGLGEAESNTIVLSKVQAYVPVVEIALPTTMYVVGDFPASSGWSTFVPLHQGYSQDGFFYGVVYFQAGSEFKVNPDDGWKGNDKGYGQVTAEDEADAGFHSGGDSETANMKIDNAGWYNVIVKTKVANAAVNYTVTIKKAEVYTIGAAAGGSWSKEDDWKLTAPADASGEWVSPAFTGSGELRLFVDCGIDWWKTEFTIKNSDGTLYYRDLDIPNNWAENVGDDYSCQVQIGQQAYINFTAGTGYVK